MSAETSEVVKDGPYQVHNLMELARQRNRALERGDRFEEALKRIERWNGEFPETGEFWLNADGSKSDRPMPYAACYGSNGERDYMRSVARAALTSVTSEGSTQNGFTESLDEVAYLLWKNEWNDEPPSFTWQQLVDDPDFDHEQYRKQALAAITYITTTLKPNKG